MSGRLHGRISSLCYVIHSNLSTALNDNFTSTVTGAHTGRQAHGKVSQSGMVA